MPLLELRRMYKKEENIKLLYISRSYFQNWLLGIQKDATKQMQQSLFSVVMSHLKSPDPALMENNLEAIWICLEGGRKKNQNHKDIFDSLMGKWVGIEKTVINRHLLC